LTQRFSLQNEIFSRSSTLNPKLLLITPHFPSGCEDELSDNYHIKSGVPQGSILAPTLYNLYTADIPHNTLTNLVTFADDTCISSSDLDINVAINNLQNHLNLLQIWFNQWRIKINENKSSHITFTLRPNISHPPLTLNNNLFPFVNSVKYLGIHLDKRITWATHIKTKKVSLKLKLNSLRHILRSNTPFNNKTLIYKQLIRPAMTNGIQIC